MTVWNHLRAIALLPLMNVLVVPSLIVGLTREVDLAWVTTAAPAGVLAAAVGLLVLLAGLALILRSIALFVRLGNGTLAPWDPTRRLITGGLYAYCRNPMKIGLFLILIGESLSLRSTALATWAAFFIVVNVVYIRLSEEPGLRRRFGQAYDDYCAAVPRWLPQRVPARATSNPGAPRRPAGDGRQRT